MSGLKDCGVIIIFCFPITPIINFSNAFCRLTSFDSQVPERQKPSPDIRIGPLEWDIRCSACGKLWRGFLFYESQLWLMISSYESFGRNLSFFFFCNSSLLDNEWYLEISSLILQASTNVKNAFQKWRIEKMRLSSCSVVASIFILFSQGKEFNVVISIFMTVYVCSYIFSITPGNHNIETNSIY